MKYGCIGEHLGHSFSREIHRIIADYEYELCEVAPEELDSFMSSADFIAINVTIPYKERVIPHLYCIDDHARAIGAVNTVVRRDGKLWGYNTDFFGLSELFAHAKIDPKGKKALILGTGGTSKTAFAVLRALGAREIIKVSRHSGEGTVGYDEAYTLHRDADIIVNTTPVGMYPNCDSCPIEIEKFTRLSGVIDAVYNPLRTRLVSRARELGIPAEGGLYMLVAQGVMASEIFTGTPLPLHICESTYRRILSEKENIVLVGMPTSGKSTVGRIISDITDREFLDTDTLITQKYGMTPAEIILSLGESEFRRRESEIIKEISAKGGAVIATGGGAPLIPENLSYLRANGRVYFIDRSPYLLIPSPDRPLSSGKEALTRLYEKRHPIYLSIADVTVNGDGDAEKIAKKITEIHGEDKT